MSARTPTPWFPHKSDQPNGDFSWTIFAEGYGAVGYWKGHKQWHTDCNWLLKEADAHLIAAAPDLLSALKDAMRSSRKDFKAGPEGNRQHREAYAEQFAAIAKAEGRS